MKYFFKIFFIIVLFSSYCVKADEVSNWLKGEIDTILDSYKNPSLSNFKRFELIEKTINNNFAGTGIAKFVAGESWQNASKVEKKDYIRLFKRHLALNIASLMQGYSDQNYELTNSKYDSKNKVSLIDMKIINETGNLLVTWRVKKSKNRNYVIDLIVADISLVVTKRSEFNSMLKKVNYNLLEFNKILDAQNESSYSIIIGN
ncbi:MAG: hypothetical protein CFH18_00329 [Alphaproteobacteria bacterium MarineAlpha5_Bin8]|nr:MAG: hypothetical protein CFH17_00718 [Alphaproteobacteria bacterium MarineAlpha5_Bin7]PPR47904.1 MAG: hypothetical protein CFH18_00329 [Alphaproteobacteria bacterium MarineAlpha5_Bin8]PPR53622.1 MAG: hypothetical protein CFH16_00907 [Alphaproteobacteria bacterium MarineAlpha5_Bin6]